MRPAVIATAIVAGTLLVIQGERISRSMVEPENRSVIVRGSTEPVHQPETDGLVDSQRVLISSLDGTFTI